jgi:hypothetical protein
VATPKSDVDVTLFVYDGADAGATDPALVLSQFGKALKVKSFNVDESALRASVPVLKVQKDSSSGMPFHVDISFNNHSAVHKSHVLRELFDGLPGASGLALLVKMWKLKVGLTGPDYLSSHGWMLLVARFCSEALLVASEVDASEVDFFKWFVQTYPSDTEWTIGAREPPWEFEKDNVARCVVPKAKHAIVNAARVAIQNGGLACVPWPTAKKK